MQDSQNVTDVYSRLLDSEGEGDGGMIWENDIETCILSCKKRIASLCLMQDIACLELVHGDDPEKCYGEGGGRGVHVWERTNSGEAAPEARPAGGALRPRLIGECTASREASLLGGRGGSKSPSS